MKKFLAAIAVIVGVFSLFVYMNTPSKQRMNEELKKPEVVEVIEEAIKKRDSKAFTEAGKIKTYNIDYDKTYYIQLLKAIINMKLEVVQVQRNLLSY